MPARTTTAKPDRHHRLIVPGPGTLNIAVVVVAALYFGREVLVPIALAALLSFVLAPAVRLLQGWRFGRAPAVITVVVLAFTILFGLAGVMVREVDGLARDLPSYEATMLQKIETLRGAAVESRTLRRAADMFGRLGKALDTVPVQETTAGSATAAEAAQNAARAAAARAVAENKVAPRTTADGELVPVPVEVRQPLPGALSTLRNLIDPLLYPMATTGIILVFVIFILVQREDLRNRLIRLAGAHDLQRTTAAIDDAARRLSRMFLLQLSLNAGFGVVIAIGLMVIGVPSAILWGILAAVLRFVPYVGGLIAAALPLTIAAAVDPGWTMFLATLALFAVVEPLLGQVVEPLVYGRNTGLSPIAVILSATFWAWVWGPIGLIMAVPLTICLVVLGRHVDQLEFLDVMLGDRAPLTPPETFYQRLLSADPDEAAERAEIFLKDRPLSRYYDEVAIEGLRLAQADAARGALDQTRIDCICQAAAQVIDHLADEEELPPGATVEPAPDAGIVLCLPGRGAFDPLAVAMLAQVLGKYGLRTRQGPADALSGAQIGELDFDGVTTVCLCYLDPSKRIHMRYAVRRIRHLAPGVRILLACWAPVDAAADAADVQADGEAATLHQAARFCLEAAPEEVTVGPVLAQAAG